MGINEVTSFILQAFVTFIVCSPEFIVTLFIHDSLVLSQLQNACFKLNVVNTLTPKLSKSCYSRAVPGRPARGPYQVRENLHSIARIKVEMMT